MVSGVNVVREANARSKHLTPDPGIHNHSGSTHSLMEAFPTVAIWRRSVEDKKTSTIPDELWWDAPRGLVRVNQGPHEDLEFVDVKIRGHFEDAIVNKNITLKSIEPYDRFLFGATPA